MLVRQLAGLILIEPSLPNEAGNRDATILRGAERMDSRLA
jgi:hypothetical protein